MVTLQTSILTLNGWLFYLWLSSSSSPKALWNQVGFNGKFHDPLIIIGTLTNFLLHVRDTLEVKVITLD